MNPPIPDDDPIHDFDAKRHEPHLEPIKPKPKGLYASIGFAFTVSGCGAVGYALTYFFDVPDAMIYGVAIGFVIALWDLKNAI
jgi:hypothetical protein